MPVSEIHHVAVCVSNLERATHFYTQGLGYRPTLSTTVEGKHLETSLDVPAGTTARIQYVQGPSQVGQIELIEWNGDARRTAEAGHLELGTFLLSFEVPLAELDELHERLEKAGAECLSGPQRVFLPRYGYITTFAARDPDGNLLEFVSLPDRETIAAHRRSESVEA